jgi:hypothetical protein
MATATPFDPCRHWLGVSALELDDPWKLLGLAAGEADPIRILQASEARLAHLRAVEAGPYEVARRALVSRVEEARDRLLAMASGPSSIAGGVPPRTGLAMPPPPPGARDPVIKAAPFPSPAPPAPAPYPQPSFAQQPSFTPQPSFVPQHSHPAQPFAPVAVEAPPQHDPFAFRTGPVYRRKSNHGPLLAVTAALLAAVVGLGLYAVNMKPKPKPVTPTPDRKDVAADFAKPTPRETAKREERRSEPPKQEPDDDPPSGVLGQREPPPQPRMRDASPKPVEKRPASDARDDEVAVAAVKPEPPMPESPSMSKDGSKGGTDAASDTKPIPADDPAPAPPAPGTPDDPDMLAKIDKGVKTCLEALMRKEFDTAARALKPLEEIATEKREADRIAGWQQLVEYSKGFLDYRDQAIDAMKSGDEYDVNGKKIAIVEVNDTEVVIRVTGMEKRWDRGSLPTAVELAIVTSWFDANPANMLYLGASYIARPEPDLEKAKEHWSKAMIGGANASLLLPLLDEPVLVESLGEG